MSSMRFIATAGAMLAAVARTRRPELGVSSNEPARSTEPELACLHCGRVRGHFSKRCPGHNSQPPEAA